VRIGLIGAGAIARRHLQTLAGCDVEVTAVCDPDPGRAAEAAAGPGAVQYSGWEQMLEVEPLDAVLICTPPMAHAEPFLAALARGLAVYVEKPFARTLPDGLAMVEAWQSGACVCAVGYQWRSLSLLDTIRQALGDTPPGLLVSRSYGPTEAGRGDLGGAGSWFSDPARSGGILFELGSHDIDLQLAIAGPAVAVQGMSSSGRLALAGAPAADLDDAVAVVLQFAAGGLGAIHVAWNPAQDPPVYTLDVQAPEAALSLVLDPELRLTGRARGKTVEATAAADPRRSSLERFLAAARAGDREMVHCTPADALGTLRVALACEAAVASGVRVPVTT
jgi:myo-inositol 2-dehydrogenase/D-chiro-inositol 1-dehydrogenase